MQLMRDVLSKTRLAERAGRLDAPDARWIARLFMLIYDHGIFRTFWTNFYQVAPGVYRGNQPSQRRFRRLREHYGIRTVINLRGSMMPFSVRLEEEGCADAGLDLIAIEGLSSRNAPPKEAILDLIHAFETAEKPLFFHCKSGADRTSLAAAVYRLVFEGADIATAKAEFSIRYIHFAWTKAGVIDALVDWYAEAREATGISFRDWVTSSYDADVLQARFDAARRS